MRQRPQATNPSPHLSPSPLAVLYLDAALPPLPPPTLSWSQFKIDATAAAKQLQLGGALVAAAAAECDWVFYVCSLGLFAAAWPSALRSLLQSSSNTARMHVDAAPPPLPPPPLIGPKTVLSVPPPSSAAVGGSAVAAMATSNSQFSALGTSR